MDISVSRGTSPFELRDPGKVRITDDDKKIFLELYRHSILDASDFRLMFPHRSDAWLGIRLRKLTDGGYLTRPRQQTRRRKDGGGSFPLVYTLGNGGARYLKEELDLPVRVNRWITTSDELSPIHIEHTLEQGKFMVSLCASAERRSDTMGFEYPEEIYARLRPEFLKKKRLPYLFRSPVDWLGWREKEATIPDGFCALRYLKEAPEKSSRYLFVEIDRTPTICPKKKNRKGKKFFNGNSWLRKAVVYGHGYRSQAHTEIFAVPTFQVLTVTTTPARVEQMIETYQEYLAVAPHKVSPIRFLFTDFGSIAQAGGDVLAVEFLDGAGKVRRLDT